MSFNQFKKNVAEVGIKFACRMATQEGVCVANIQLWVNRLKPQSNAERVASLVR